MTKTCYCPLLESRTDREAWVACCSRRFTPVARRIAGDDDLAQDILQESWLRVLEHVGAYRGTPPACAWVHSIVRNCALEFGRKQHRATEEPADPGIEDPAPDPEEQARKREMISLLHEMVDALPATYREVCKTDSDDLIETLYFPATSVTLRACDHDSCPERASGWVDMASSTSSQTQVEAELRMKASARVFDACDWNW